MPASGGGKPASSNPAAGGGMPASGGGKPAASVTAIAPPRRMTAWTAYRQALLTNCLNPKVIIFLVTLAPQFMPKHPTLVDKLAIEVVSIISVMAWFTVVTLAVRLCSAWLERPRVARSISAVMGVVLLGIGVRIAISLLKGNIAISLL
jgi:threonine/homoserine/homoserine lactone efflux protein